jgi:hypothetical protein
VNADADTEREPVLGPQLGVELLQFLEHRQAGVHGALGAVLARVGVAEVDDDPVAGIASGVAVEAIGGARTRLLITAEDLAEVLGIKRLGQRRGADDVAEHHRHVAAVGRAGRAGIVSRGRRRVPQRAAAPAAESHSVGILQAAVRADHPARGPHKQLTFTCHRL